MIGPSVGVGWLIGGPACLCLSVCVLHPSVYHSVNQSVYLSAISSQMFGSTRLKYLGVLAYHGMVYGELVKAPLIGLFLC